MYLRFKSVLSGDRHFITEGRYQDFQSYTSSLSPSLSLGSAILSLMVSRRSLFSKGNLEATLSHLTSSGRKFSGLPKLEEILKSLRAHYRLFAPR